jgi:hypothetical protein
MDTHTKQNKDIGMQSGMQHSVVAALQLAGGQQVVECVEHLQQLEAPVKPARLLRSSKCHWLS